MWDAMIRGGGDFRILPTESSTKRKFMPAVKRKPGNRSTFLVDGYRYHRHNSNYCDQNQQQCCCTARCDRHTAHSPKTLKTKLEKTRTTRKASKHHSKNVILTFTKLWQAGGRIGREGRESGQDGTDQNVKGHVSRPQLFLLYFVPTKRYLIRIMQIFLFLISP